MCEMDDATKASREAVRNLAFSLLGGVKMLRLYHNDEAPKLVSTGERFREFLVAVAGVDPPPALLSAVKLLEEEFGAHPGHEKDVQYIKAIVPAYYEATEHIRSITQQADDSLT